MRRLVARIRTQFLLSAVSAAVLACGSFPALCAAQGATYANILESAQHAPVGVAIYYAWYDLSYSAPPGSATTDEKTYGQLLSRKNQGAQGPAVGFSYSSWGLVISHAEGAEPINQQITDSTGPAFVKSAHRESTAVALLFRPYRWIYFGLGHDTGVVDFKQIDATGMDRTRSFPVDNNYFTVALAFGFNPRKPGLSPLLTFYTRTPLERSPFAVTANAVGLGFYF